VHLKPPALLQQKLLGVLQLHLHKWLLLAVLLLLRHQAHNRLLLRLCVLMRVCLLLYVQLLCLLVLLLAVCWLLPLHQWSPEARVRSWPVYCHCCLMLLAPVSHQPHHPQ
jgi:hypothetical protein